MRNSQKTVFPIALYTNMAAVTSRENQEYGRLITRVKTMNKCRWEYKVWISIQTDLQLVMKIYLQSTIQMVQHRFEGMRDEAENQGGMSDNEFLRRDAGWNYNAEIGISDTPAQIYN